jgi:hypothetical protein
MTADSRGLAGTIRAVGAKQKNEAKTELTMSVLAPNQSNEAALKLELKAAPSFLEERVDLRQAQAFRASLNDPRCPNRPAEGTGHCPEATEKLARTRLVHDCASRRATPIDTL